MWFTETKFFNLREQLFGFLHKTHARDFYHAMVHKFVKVIFRWYFNRNQLLCKKMFKQLYHSLYKGTEGYYHTSFREGLGLKI